MSSQEDLSLVRDIITNNRYLTLATADGQGPWAAPLEYMVDERLHFFFLSKADSRHAQHIEAKGQVSLAIFDREQPEYSPDASVTLRGVQIRASARSLSQDEFPEAVQEAIAALDPPMPPYQVFEIAPSAFYVPKIIDGVNERVEVVVPDTD